MEYRFRPQGVCSSEMIIDVEGDVINKVQIVNGCPRKHSRSWKTS